MRGAAGLARLEIRRRRRGIIGLSLLTGLMGAAVVGPLVGARRTATAYDRLVEASDAADVSVSSVMFDPSQLPLRDSPTVAGVRAVGAFIGRVDDTKDWMYQFAGPDREYPGVLVAGRWWSETADDEVVISAVTAKNTGLKVGDLLAYSLYTRDQFRSVADLSFAEPAGPALRLRVVGVMHLADDSQADPTSKNVWAGPSFYSRHNDVVSIDNAAVRLRRGLQDLDAFRSDLGRALDAHASATGVRREELFVNQNDRAVQREAGTEATGVAVIGLLAFASVAAVAGVVVVAQTYRRQLAAAAGDQVVLRAVGFDRRQRLAGLAAPGLVSGLLGSLPAVIGSAALSPMFPIGRARDLEPDPGVDLNVALILLAAAAWLLLVAAATAAVALAELVRTSSDRLPGPRSRRLPGWLRSIGAAAPLAFGVQLATDPGRGRTAIPVRSTLAGSILGVAGVLAAATFAVGLESVQEEPARFGLSYDISVEASTAAEAGLLARLTADRDVAAAARIWQATVQLDDRSVESYASEPVKGRLNPVVLSGRLPSEGEVAVGPQLLRSVGKRIGDEVSVAGPLGVHTLRVVGSVLSPQESAEPFNGEVVLSPEDQSVLVEPGQRFPEFTIRFARGVDQDAKVAALDALYPFGVIDESWPHRPTEIAQLAQLRPVVNAVVVLFVTVLLGSIVHGLVVMLRRRRPELGVLRAIGFAPRQLRLLTLSSASTPAIAGLVTGLPLGVAAGGVTWTSVAAGLYLTVPWPWPIAALVLSVGGLLVLTTLLGLVTVRPALTGPVTAALRRD